MPGPDVWPITEAMRASERWRTSLAAARQQAEQERQENAMKRRRRRIRPRWEDALLKKIDADRRADVQRLLQGKYEFAQLVAAAGMSAAEVRAIIRLFQKQDRQRRQAEDEATGAVAAAESAAEGVECPPGPTDSR